MRKTFALAALLALAPFALAGDEAPDPKAIAEAYVHGEEALRAEAEKVVAGASADLLRKILAEVAEIARADAIPALPAPVFAPAPAPPPGAMPAPRPGDVSCGGPDLAAPPLPLPPTLLPGEAPANVRAVNVEFRFVQLTEAAADRLGLAPKAPTGPRALDAEALAQLLTALEKDAEVSLLSAPRIAVYDRQTANVSMVNQISYIQDYDIETGNGTAIADPIVGVVSEGLHADLRPAVSADAKSILFDVSFSLAQLLRPIPVWKTKLTTGEEVVIQLPELHILKRTQRVVVPAGGTVLLDSWPQVVQVTKDGTTTDERHVGVALLKAEVIEAADLHPTNFVPPEPGPEDSLPKPAVR